MYGHLRIDIVWNLSDQRKRHFNYRPRIQRGERSKDSVGAIDSLAFSFKKIKKQELGNSLCASEKRVPHTNQLSNDAYNIQMRAICKQKVPEMQHFR